MTEKEALHDILYTAWRYNDKPHHLYSAIRRAAIEFVRDQPMCDEIVRLMDIEYERDRGGGSKK